MCRVCQSGNEFEGLIDDEELWRMLPDLEGRERAHALSQLSIGTCKDFAGKVSILLAEGANKIYEELGTPEDSIDYLYTYEEIASNKAYLEDYVGAVEAGLKALPLVHKHKMSDTYGQLQWELLQWMVKAGQFEKAREFLEQQIAEEHEMALWQS